MTIPKDNFIKIPTWLVIIAVPIVIAASTGFVTNLIINARSQKQIEINTEILHSLPTEFDQKVDRREFDLMKQQLDRIEVKLDKHMAR